MRILIPQPDTQARATRESAPPCSTARFSISTTTTQQAIWEEQTGDNHSLHHLPWDRLSSPTTGPAGRSPPARSSRGSAFPCSPPQ